MYHHTSTKVSENWRVEFSSPLNEEASSDKSKNTIKMRLVFNLCQFENIFTKAES